MQYRVFGRTGWRVSAIGLGCWQLGGQFGEISEADGIATVHAAIEAGINLFDSADSYGPRRSEEVLGKALAGGRRPHVFVATKVGNFARPDGHSLSYQTPEHIYACCDASLHRLQTDYIDLYQCHIREHPRHDVFLEAFERLQEAGKIRAYGTSSFIPGEIEYFDTHGRCNVAQIPYSVLERTYETDALPLCQERNIGVLVRGPLAQGVLAGKFPSDHQFTDPTRTGWNTGDAQQRFQERRAAAEALRPMSGEGRSMAQIALAFAIAHPANTCAIPGARSPQQVQANAAAADLVLTDDELTTLRAIAPPA